MIFYGLTQAARALGAARIPSAPAWRLKRHGVSQNHGVHPETVADLTLKKQRGALSEVSKYLKSPTPPDNVKLGSLLACLPLVVEGSRWQHEPRALHLANLPQGDDASFFVSTDKVLAWAWPVHKNLIFEEQATPGSQDDSAGDVESWMDKRRRRVSAHLARLYPSLGNVTVSPDGHQGALPSVAREDDAAGDDYVLVLEFEVPEALGGNGLRRKFLSRFGYPNRSGHRSVPPLLDGNDEPCHPLITWWAVLFGLSVLARYEPALWAQSIDVDQSPDAVALEEILDYSLDVVPELILQAIRGDDS